MAKQKATENAESVTAPAPTPEQKAALHTLAGALQGHKITFEQMTAIIQANTYADSLRLDLIDNTPEGLKQRAIKAMKEAKIPVLLETDIESTEKLIKAGIVNRIERDRQQLKQDITAAVNDPTERAQFTAALLKEHGIAGDGQTLDKAAQVTHGLTLPLSIKGGLGK